jgi:cobalt-zinc-cadmium efflux system outer membrane protein
MGFGIASIPIPVFNRNHGEISRGKSEQLRAGFQADAAKAEVIQDVESAYASFVSSRERVRLYEEIYLQIEDFSFHKGGASILDFLDAARTYRATQLAYRQQLAAYLNSLAQLQVASGMDVKP